MSHDDDRRHLGAKFRVDNRYANFGPAMQSVNVQGFRGLKDLKIDFASPITALSGLNGTGKSTLAQLIVCGYKKPSTAALRRYYVKDFFPVSAADPEPLDADARAVFTYTVQTGAEPQQVTVARAAKE